MKDQVTTIEQWERLKKFGVPAKKASLCWVKDPNENEYNLAVHDECCYEIAGLEPIPAYTVADLLGMMPTRSAQPGTVLYTLSPYGIAWSLSFHPSVIDYNCTSVYLVALLCDAIITLLSNGYKLNL